MSAPASDWLGAMVESTRELAAELLSCDVGDAANDVKTQLEGACIAIVGNDATVEMAIFSDESGCDELTRRFLAMEAHEPGPSPEVTRDALGEIVNILAGAVKTRMLMADAELRLGLPLCVRAPFGPVGECDHAEIGLRVGGALVQLNIWQRAHAA
jgi:hypothetical protein